MLRTKVSISIKYIEKHTLNVLVVYDVMKTSLKKQ